MITTNHLKAAAQTVWDIFYEPVSVGLFLVAMAYGAYYLFYLHGDTTFWAMTWFIAMVVLLGMVAIIMLLAFRFVMDEVPYRFWVNMQKYRHDKKG